MKPPWKYFAQLVSRQRPSEIADKASACDNARKLVEIELRPAATMLLASQEATPATEQANEGTPEDVVTAPAAVDSEIDAKTPDLPLDLAEAAENEGTEEPVLSDVDPLEQRPPGEAGVQLPKLRQAKLASAKKVSIGATDAILAIRRDAPVPATSSPANPLFDNAAGLDEEIKHLKGELAHKLRLQNAQLKKMLERFERS
jgi:hypothetical protein